MQEAIRLHIGSGKVYLPGFINIDLDSEDADLKWDVRHGLPFDNDSVSHIFSEHFIEHLTQTELIVFLREVRRVLKPSGRIRLATPDLNQAVQSYLDGTWRRRQWINKFGYEWIQTGAEYLNICFREWGHQYLLDQEELNRLARFVGLIPSGKYEVGESHDPWLRGLETRDDSFVVEYRKKCRQIKDLPLVSMVIPACKPQFFAQSLKSAIEQTYEPKEILVLDDSKGKEIESITREYLRKYPKITLRYVRNDPPEIGEAPNLTKGIQLAKGDLIKPLYDDDWLEQNAVEVLVKAIQSDPNVTLAMGWRDPVNIHGRPLEPAHWGGRFSNQNRKIHGPEVVKKIFSQGFNNLGEPICMLFWREDALAIEEPNVMSLFGRLCSGCGDVCFVLHLLSKGDLAYVARKIAWFRMPSEEKVKYLRKVSVWNYLEFNAKRLGMVCYSNASIDNISKKFIFQDNPSNSRVPYYSIYTESAQYQHWLNRSIPPERELIHRLERIQKWPNQPKFHCVVPLIDSSKQNYLADTLDSIAAQSYEHWRLSVISPLPCPDPLWQDLPQLAWHQMDSKSSLAEALNKAIAAIEAHWVWQLKPGDRLETHALLTGAEAVHARPEWRLIYMDEGQVSSDGVFHAPRFKPDFNLDLLRANDYLGPIMVRRDALLELGGLTDLFGAESYDLALRVLDIWGEKGFGHLAEVLVHRPDQDASVTSERSAAQTHAVNDHLARCEVSAKVREGFLAGIRSIQYPLDKTPRVSILIPTKDRLDLLQPCVESVLEKTVYPDYEIIVIDNQSRERETLDYLEQLTVRDSRVRVLPYPHPYNFSAINNAAAEVATGEFLLLLNNDTVILQENWLERLMRHGLRSEVGAVGARLVYPDGTVQHAGVILGMGGVGVAEHWHIGSSLDDPGYMGRLQLVQNLSAVTAACLLVRKSLYREIGGLNPERYRVLFNDIDFCLRLRQRNYLIVWTPEVTVMHHGSGSLRSEYDFKGQQRAIQEKDAMLEDWLPVLARDPAYNPNLSLRDRTPTLEISVDVPWTHLRRDTLKIVGMPLDDAGIGEYRMRAPVRQLTNTGAVSSKLLPPHAGESNPLRMSVTELVRAAPDVVFLHEALTDSYVDLWETYRRYTDTFLIYSQDDLIFQLPSRHPLAGKNKDAKKRLRKMLRMSDRLIVGTRPMAQALEGMIEDIRVVPNRLEWSRWGNIESHRRKGGKPRVGWAGAIQHHADLMFLLPILETTAPEVDWVFLGMCPEPLRPYVAEFHSGVAFDGYPEKLASLDLDLAMAPLERNKYNEAKSNLRLLEYGILGWPVICTDIYPYQYENPPVCRLPNQPDLWIKAIRERVNEPDALAKEGEQLRDWVRKSWILEDHLDEWLTALTPTRSPDGSPRSKIPIPGRS